MLFFPADLSAWTYLLTNPHFLWCPFLILLPSCHRSNNKSSKPYDGSRDPLIRPTGAYHKLAPLTVAGNTTLISKSENFGRGFEHKGRDFKHVVKVVKRS